jgi:hypothetical protein
MFAPVASRATGVAVPRLFGCQLLFFALIPCAALPSCAADKISSAETAGLVERQNDEAVVPFQLHRGNIIVAKCSAGGLKDLTAIIDTGASETVLDIALARKLRLALEPDSATFINQRAKVWAVTIPAFELGPTHVDRLEGIAADLSSLTAVLGIRPQVLIGMDVLRRSSFLIDYQSHRLIFGPSARLAHSMPLLPSGDSNLRFAVIESTILGYRVRLQVDTGFENVLVYQGRVPGLDRGGLSGAASFRGFASRQEDARIVNAAQSLTAYSFASVDVQIGEWHVPHAQISVIDGPAPESAEFDGLVGAALLSRQRVAFDFEHGIISWE